MTFRREDPVPEPVVSGSLARRRTLVGVRDLYAPLRFGVAIVLAGTVRLMWAIVDRLAFYAGHELPGGLITGSCVLVLGAVLLFAPVVLSLEMRTVTPLRLVIAPPRGDFGPLPILLRIAAAGYVVAIVGGLWLLLGPSTARLAHIDRATSALLSSSVALIVVLAAAWARQVRQRRSGLRLGA